MATRNNTLKLKFDSARKYAPAPESRSAAKIKDQYELFINGKFEKPLSKKYFDTINPATEEKLSRIAEANEADVDKAVKAARSAFGVWSKMAPKERGKYIFRIARMVQERARELAVVETLNGGKPIRESRDFDIPVVGNHFFYYAGWADKLEYAFPNRNAKPLGVAGQIIPWNFPLLMAAWKIAPALATGNTVVLKPAETTPLTALLLAEIIQRAIAGTGKKATLELGGKAANIIFDDAPIDQAVEGVINGIFFNQGHVCCAGSRLYVQESVYKEVVRKLKDRLETLIVGDPMDKNTDIGAINSKQQLDQINKYLKIGVKEGAEMYQSSVDLPSKGFFCRPTIFTNVAQSNRISQEEIFGPVLTIQTFRTDDEVIEKANNTPYGLSAGVWTDKGSKIFNMTTKLRAGVVWANTFNQFDPTSPFGGYKESGYGREGGLHGLAPYLNLEHII